MKPTDFKPPECLKEGRSLIQDRVFHLKKDDYTFSFPSSWQAPELFANSSPVKMEFCSGNGSWIAHRALTEPGTNWVAVEIKLGRTKKIWSKIKNLELNNLFIVNGEGELATTRHFPSDSIDEIFINFPDPWPKRHHLRHRLVKPSFVEALAKLLKGNGTVTIVTDDAGHSEWVIRSFKMCPQFKSFLPPPYYTLEHSNYGSSYFEELWRSKGCEIRYHIFTKSESC